MAKPCAEPFLLPRRSQSAGASLPSDPELPFLVPHWTAGLGLSGSEPWAPWSCNKCVK